jgi:O-antigen/teichoic acid export membrane protein
MMDARMEHRAAAVSLVTGLSTVLSILFQLVSVPVCLHYWGKEAYGAWLAVFTASTVFRTVDGGFINFVGNRLNLLYHQDMSELRRVLASAVVGILILGVAQLGLVLLTISVGHSDWLFGDSGGAAVARGPAALAILVTTWVLSGSYLGIVHRLLIPAGLMYQSTWWSMGYQAAAFAGVTVAAIAGLDLLGASIIMAAIQASVYLASAFYVKVRLPRLFPWWKDPDWRMGLADLRGSFVFTLSGIFQQGATNGAVLLVSAMLGAAALPAFTTVRTMVNLWNSLTTMLTVPLLPDLARYHATGQAPKLLALTGAHSWLLGTLVNIGVVASYPVMEVVYRYWTRGLLSLDRDLFAVLLAAVVLSSAGALMGTYLTGVNDARAVLGLAFVRAAVTLGFGGLAAGLGLVGIGLGILLAELACLALTVMLFFPGAVRGLKRDARRPPMGWAGAQLGCAMLFLSGVAVSDGFPIALFLVCLLVMPISSWFGWRQLDDDVRRRLALLVRGFIQVGPGARA